MYVCVCWGGLIQQTEKRDGREKKIQREPNQFNLESKKYEGQDNYLICIAPAFVPPPPLSHPHTPPIHCSSKMNSTGAAVASKQQYVTLFQGSVSATAAFMRSTRWIYIEIKN